LSEGGPEEIKVIEGYIIKKRLCNPKEILQFGQQKNNFSPSKIIRSLLRPEYTEGLWVGKEEVKIIESDEDNEF